MRVVVVAAVVLAAAFAGCSGKDAEANLGNALKDAAAAAGNMTANQTVNHPPLANLTADVLAGAAPLNVTFQLNGTDEDKDNLTWTLKVGNTTLGNGTSLPANVTHQFVDAGNFSVVFSVTDGSNATSANVTVSVSVALPTGPNICEAEGETEIPGGFYQDRMSWIFEESNGMPGLQYTAEASTIGEYDSAGEGCENGDTLLF